MPLSRRRRLLGVLAAAALAWLLLGVGYHRLETACHDSRHAGDLEGTVYGDPVGIAADLALWPVFLAADAVNGSDCRSSPAP
jgi:hypothetical protein